MKVQPQGDRLLVQKIEMEGKVGSIVLPDSVTKDSSYGRVLAAGPGEQLDLEGVKRRKMLYKEGDVVLWGMYSGETVRLSIGSEECFLLRDADVLAKVTLDEKETA